jgi:undecaprenyl-phosphate 4-deoxy-4-formamido-L-arabinose transferase
VSELVASLEAVRPFEIVLVNDCSPDGVQRVIDRLCAGDGRIRQVSPGRNLGQHGATLRGFAAAKGDVVVTVDDDGQNPPSACLAVAQALERQDLDVVYGRFRSVEQSVGRRLASRVNRWISRHTLGNSRNLPITNVRAIRGDLARLLGRAGTAYPYVDGMIFRATSHIGEVPVEHRPRGQGESTYGLGKLLHLWLSHVTTLTVFPLKVAMFGSFGASLLGLVAGVVEVVRALAERRAPPGWLSLFVAVTFLFSLLFAFLGIISAYLGRMYVALNERGLDWSRPPRSQLEGSTQSRGRVTGAS